MEGLGAIGAHYQSMVPLPAWGLHLISVVGQEASLGSRVGEGRGGNDFPGQQRAGEAGGEGARSLE